MNTIPTALIDRHLALGDRLRDLEHRLFRTGLADTFKPRRGGDPSLQPLRLTPQGMAELNGAITAAKLAILDAAEAMQIARSGRPDSWISEYRTRLRTEMRQIWS